MNPPAAPGVGAATIPQPTNDQGQTIQTPTTTDLGGTTGPEQGGNVLVIVIVVVVLALILVAVIAAIVGFILSIRRRRSKERKCDTSTKSKGVFIKPSYRATRVSSTGGCRGEASPPNPPTSPPKVLK